jgi:hypothetical protein
MFSPTAGGVRRHITTTIAAGAVASLAASLALATAGTASADVLFSLRYDLKASESVSIPPTECDVLHTQRLSYLVNRDYGPFPNVPPGIAVYQDGGVAVSMRRIYDFREGENYVVGATGTATNWNAFPRSVTIVWHCTPGRALGYR